MEYSLEPIEITKEFILNNLSEEEIFEHYGVKIQKGLFCSKLRNDKNPTCALYRNKKGRLMLKDFGSDFCSDCFGYVEALYNVSYYMSLVIVANDFGLINRSNIPKHKAKLEYSGNKIEEKESANIQVEIRDFTEEDLAWWGKYGITAETLKKFKVFACKTIWLNGNIFYINNNSQAAYGYFGGIKDGQELWRIYFPGRRKYKFVSNWKSLLIQGAHMLKKQGDDYIVVTKSLKDVMTLYEYGIAAIAPCSENEFLTESQYKRLKNKYKHVILLYDNDNPGLHSAWTIRKKFPDIEVIYLPINGGDKDISDFRKQHGHKKTLELINKTKAYYEEKWTKEEFGCLWNAIET